MSDAVKAKQLANKKLLAHGFHLSNGIPVPPPGMGEFNASDIIEKCMAEANAELNAPQLPGQPYWHEHNPWKAEILYVPIIELAACCSSLGKTFAVGNTGETFVYDLTHLLEHWAQCGSKLDAYILTGGQVFTAGVRFGPEAHDYLSPGFTLKGLLELLKKYGRKH